MVVSVINSFRERMIDMTRELIPINPKYLGNNFKYSERALYKKRGREP